VRVNISKEDLLRFTERSYAKGLFQAVGFLAIVATTGGFSWWAFMHYTLHHGSDGEDTPNYVEFKWRNFYDLFLNVLHWKSLFQNLARLFTLKPTSRGWRGRSYQLDTWERFILQRANEKACKHLLARFAIFPPRKRPFRPASGGGVPEPPENDFLSRRIAFSNGGYC